MREPPIFPIAVAFIAVLAIGTLIGGVLERTQNRSPLPSTDAVTECQVVAMEPDVVVRCGEVVIIAHREVKQ